MHYLSLTPSQLQQRRRNDYIAEKRKELADAEKEKQRFVNMIHAANAEGKDVSIHAGAWELVVNNIERLKEELESV